MNQARRILFISPILLNGSGGAPPDATGYIRVLAVGPECSSGVSSLSDEVAITTPPIVL